MNNADRTCPCRTPRMCTLAPCAMLLGAAAAHAGEAADRSQRYGIDRRVPWTTSRVVGSPDPPLPYRARRAFPRLSFNRPLYLACEPGTDRILVVEQGGRVLA